MEPGRSFHATTSDSSYTTDGAGQTSFELSNGSDTFKFSSTHVLDVIKDFNPMLDKIEYVGSSFQEASWEKSLNNSGHYFLHGEMNVEKIATDLSKSEALALERLLLSQMSGRDLWNIKDYEPYTDNLDKRFTDSDSCSSS